MSGSITRALLSVSDKRGLVDLARALAAHGVELLSTGGTARALREAGLPVRDVSEFTGSPEIMDGRVKTLHPRVHGGLLMRDRDDDRAALASIGGAPIDLVAVNLYPFEATVARGASHGEAIEQIDIGGPSMIRSAAKGHDRVTVLVDPDDYGAVAETLGAGGPGAALRARLAAKAFAHTAAYDAAIAAYLTGRDADGGRLAHPGALQLVFEKAYDCRYGENPHQSGAFYVERGAPDGSLARARSLDEGGKELSYNNLVDLDAALDCVREFERPAAVVVKHTNPAGVAVAERLEAAFRLAREADALSAFGGIVALNRPCDEATARAMTESFLECVVAPSYDDAALAVLRGKKTLRIVATGGWLPPDHRARTYKRVDGGLVVQDRDATAAGEVAGARVATRRAPTEAERAALEFAWRVAKHVKSNAIVLAHPDRTVGVGAGQMSRVVSVELAVKKAGASAEGAALASDAFFPFPDGVEAAAAAGVTAVVQPGGSKKDDEVIAAADRAGMAMLLTGVRHFRH